MHDLARHLKERNLVSIYREPIDSNSIEGYVLALSDDLVVLQFVYDFKLDGIKVIRTADISEVDCSDTNLLQKDLMSQEGLEQIVPFDATFNTGNWRALLSQFAQAYPLMILECEAQDEADFVIGRVVNTSSDKVLILGFSGDGKWDENPTSLAFGDLTSCRVGANYINVYQRYFERMTRH
jgi:hypothetical protein